MNTTRKHGGFTLLELLVVIALMGVVSTLGTSLLFSMTDAWTLTRHRAELDAQADQVFDGMRHDFERVVSPRLSNMSITGLDRTVQQERFWNQSLGDDEFAMPLLANVGNGEASRCVRVRYAIDRGGDRDTLVREANDFGYPAEKAVRTPVGPDVVWMDVEYLAGGQWVAAWDRPELPEAVRVSLTLVNPTSLEQVTRKAVFPVRVS